MEWNTESSQSPLQVQIRELSRCSLHPLVPHVVASKSNFAQITIFKSPAYLLQL